MIIRVRKNVLPRTLSDVCSVTFILIIVPLLYWFELWVVLPQMFEYGTLAYSFHFLFGNFIMINIVGNFTYTIFCDTSTRQIIVPINEAKTKNNWRLCTCCEAFAPPRSWHCNICNVCILKRDHHCIFTACCIGHYNHRYFLMFIFYLFTGTIYSFYYNNFFIWSRVSFEFPMSIFKIVFPLAIFLFGFDGSIEQFYLMLYIVSAVGMVFTGTLCVYHFNLVINGTTANDKEKRNYMYNLGWMQNLKEVFGDRWYLVWLLPYIHSTLPHNGLSWNVSSKLKSRYKKE